MGISVILLAYKEEENLKILLPKIKHQLENIGERYEIIVVDTKIPTDKTADICEENSVKYINQEEPHFAGAFRTGIKYALMDKFLILDSDGSHDPQYIPQIYYRFIKGNDVVIGSRYTKGGQTSDAKSSILMSKILNNVFRICLGIDAKDISTDFRMYHTMQLKGLDLECENYDVLQEVLLKLKINKPNLRISEVPIAFQKRIYGESKRNLLVFIISYFFTLLHLIGIRISAEKYKEAVAK